jgi:hypothetical protein
MDYDMKVQGNNTVARTLPVTTMRQILLKSFVVCCVFVSTVEALKVWIELSKSQHLIEDMFPLNWVSAGPYVSQIVGKPLLDFGWGKGANCVLRRSSRQIMTVVGTIVTD